MRRIHTIRALLGATVVAGGMAALTPRGAGFHPVACGEGALVAAVHQANDTSAADTLVSF
jgi:hypothetical protein